MPMILRTSLILFAFGLSACSGCSKKTEPTPADPIAPPSSATPSASAAENEVPAAVPGVTARAQPVAKAAPASDAGAIVTAAASAPVPVAPASAAVVDAGSAAVTASPAKSSDEIPKPCKDGFGRLGTLTFSDLGGGRVRISSSKNASALCTRAAPTQYQCDWVVEGKPTGTFAAKLDPARKSVSGSIAKGQMFSCPPSSQN
jgi:hypothetical protein